MLRFLFLFQLLPAVLFSQASFYVSPGGSDSNPGTLISPWQHAQYALNNAIPGCTIYLMGGTYQENLVVTVSGTLSNFITLKNYNAQNAIIDGGNSNGTPLLYISSKNYFVVEGLEFQNYFMNDAQGILVDGVCGNIKIQNNIIHDIDFSANANDAVNANTNSQPIIVYGDNATNAISNLTISGNEIYNCRTGFSEALAVNGNVDAFTLDGNLVHDNTNIGIDIIGHEGTSSNAANDQARNGIVKYNKTWNNVSPYASSAGIYVDGARDCSVENNISYANSYGIEIGCEAVGKTTSNITTKNNLVYGNLFAGIVVGGYDYPANSGKVILCNTTGNTVANNNLSFNPEGELVVNYTESCTWKNNLVYSSGIDNLVSDDANSITQNFDFNLYFSSNTLTFSFNSNSISSLSAWQTANGNDNASLNIDPLLVNPLSNNFHLTSLSPAIDKGDSLYTVLPGETDIDTMSRLQNGRIDIGADEYGTAVGIGEQISRNDFIFYHIEGDQLIICFRKQQTENAIVSLYDSTGKLVESKKIKKGDVSVNFSASNLAKGIYFASNGNGSSLKILK